MVEIYTAQETSPDLMLAKIAAALPDLQMPAWMQEDLLAVVKGVALQAFCQDCPDQSRLVRVWLASDGIDWSQYAAEAGGRQPDQGENSLPEMSDDSLRQRSWGHFVVEKSLETRVGESHQMTQLVEIYLYLE